MAAKDHEPHRPPDFKIAGFCVWVFGRQRSALEDYWDGNWLRVLAQCGAEGALVRASGAILHLSELQRWLEELKPLHARPTGGAELACIEPYLNAKIHLEDGRGTLVVNITPEHLTQQHQFVFEVDQSCLPELISGLERLLKEYPVRGKPDGR